MPRPKVGSTVISLRVRRPEERVRTADETMLSRVIRASFAQRRKTLYNGLRNSEELQCPQELAAEAIREAGLPENVRGEELSLEDFARVADILYARQRV